MTVCAQLRDNKKLYLAGATSYLLDGGFYPTEAIFTPAVPYQAHYELTLGTHTVHAFSLTEGHLVVVRNQEAVEAVYRIRSELPALGLFVDPDEQLGRCRLFTLADYPVFNAWQAA